MIWLDSEPCFGFKIRKGINLEKEVIPNRNRRQNIPKKCWEQQISFPTTETVAEKTALTNKAKKEVNESIKEETLVVWNNKVKMLTLQRDFANLLIEEQSNVGWRSICNNIPKGILSFALKSSVNGLSTPDN